MIYLAGPLTKDDDVTFNLEMVKLFRGQGFKVFYPPEIGRNSQQPESRNPYEHRNFFCHSDIAGMNHCTAYVNILRRSISSGSAFECGYMTAQNKPCVIVNMYDMGPKELGTMLLGSCIIVPEITAAMDVLTKLGEELDVPKNTVV